MPLWVTFRDGSWELPSNNASSPWYDAGAQTALARTPGSGNNVLSDYVLISGTHVLSLASSVTIGNTGNYNNYAVGTYDATGGGKLNVGSGVTLTLQSHIRQGNATWSFIGGTGQPTQIILSATGALTWTLSESAGATLILSGVTGGRVLVQGTNGQPHRITTGGSTAGKIYAYRTDFVGIGDASSPSINAPLANANNVLELRDCTFTSGGGINHANTLAQNIWILLDNVKFYQTQSAYCFTTLSQTVPSGGAGRRVINNCSFDKRLGNTGSFHDFFITNNFFGDLHSFHNTYNFILAAYYNNVNAHTSSSASNIPANFSLSRNQWNYCHIHNSSTTLTSANPVKVNNIDGEFSGMIFDPGDVDPSGTAISLYTTQGSNYTLNVNNNVVLPITANSYKGRPFGRLINITALTGVTINIDHNTVCVSGNDTSGSILQYPASINPSGEVRSFRSNLAVCLNGGSGYKVQQTISNGAGTISINQGSTSVTGVGTSFTTQLSTGCFIQVTTDPTPYNVLAIIGNTFLTLSTIYSGVSVSNKNYIRYTQDMVSNADYNAGFNVANGTDGNGYNHAIDGQGKIFSYTPGSHDITVNFNPFVDSTRNIASWAVVRGLSRIPKDGGGIVQNEDAYQVKINAAYNALQIDPSGKAKDLIDWVKAGWSPNYGSLYNAGHDGATIGALSHAQSTTGTTAWITYRSGPWETPSYNSNSPWYDGQTQSTYGRMPGEFNNIFNDLVTISGGHTVNLVSDITVGATGNNYLMALSTYGATGGNGVLNVSGAVLTVNSNVKQGNATWNVVSTSSKSCGINFISPSALVWQIADAHGQTNAKLNIIGTPSNRALVQSISGANGRFDGLSRTISPMSVSYCDFNGIGDVNNNCCVVCASAGTNTISFINTNFNNCGAVNIIGVATNNSFIFDTCTFNSSVQTYCFKISCTTASGTGNRYIINSWFDKAFSTSSFRDISIYGNGYMGGTFLASTSNLKWAINANNLMIGNSNATFAGDTYANNDWNYFHVHLLGSNITNYHGPIFTSNDSITFAGAIFDPGRTDSTGDILFPGSAPYSYYINNVLVLPNMSGIKVGKLVSVLGSTGKIYVENCTNATNGRGETGLIQYGETSKGFPSGCLSLRSNLSYSLDPWGSGMHVQKISTSNGAGTVQVASGNSLVIGTSTSFTSTFVNGDFINIVGDQQAYQIQTVINNTGLQLYSPYISNAGGAGKLYRPFVQDYIANSSYIAADYNAGWNLSDGTDGYGYNSDLAVTKIFSYTPGVHDIVLNADPFYDRSRNISTWAVYKGIATTGQSYDIQVSSAYDYIKASPSNRIKDLVGWVKDGWRVVNPVLYNAGHSGQTIGAMSYINTATSNQGGYTLLINSAFGTYLIKTTN